MGLLDFWEAELVIAPSCTRLVRLQSLCGIRDRGGNAVQRGRGEAPLLPVEGHVNVARRSEWSESSRLQLGELQLGEHPPSQSELDSLSELVGGRHVVPTPLPGLRPGAVAPSGSSGDGSLIVLPSVDGR